MTTAYPLAWPEGWPRTQCNARKPGQFRTGKSASSRRLNISDAVARVHYELDRLGVNAHEDCIVSTNLQVNLKGIPRGDQGEPGDPGVAVYFQKRREPMRVMAIDAYERVADNIAAVAATLEAMRAIDRHGGAQILDRAFTGFTALPSPSAPKRTCWEILGVRQDASIDEIRAAWRTKAHDAHPDRGGSQDAMAEINAARDEALRSRTVS